MNAKSTTPGNAATETEVVRATRDGDQFHYHWAARHCLSLLPGVSDLVAISIEGPSEAEGPESTDDGDEIIDVGFYFGSENLKKARLVRYVQLKHSTKRAHEPWTASGLGNTLKGFSTRFKKLLEKFTWDELKDKLLFAFTTNRPIDEKVLETIEDLAAGRTARHPAVEKILNGYITLVDAEKASFFKLFSAEGGEPDLWNQRNLLFKDTRTFLTEADSDAPLQLKDLVTRKATTEFASNPTINRLDVLRALRTDEADLLPAQCLITGPADGALAREQAGEIRSSLELAAHPIVLHAEGGVGKSILAWQLSRSVAEGSIAVLYDCFGDGLYRSTQHFRHREKDAFPQIANELAAQGLCQPLIPLRGSDSKQYMRAFVGKLTQAVGALRAKTPLANLFLIVDAADNAVVAGRDLGQSSFVPDLIRTKMPEGVKLVFSCRTHRRDYLQAPPEAIQVELRPFSLSETATHLKRHYPEATDSDIADFQRLSSSNPRVQALAMSYEQSMEEMLRALGPTPSTVDGAIAGLLADAVKKLKYRDGEFEAQQIALICQGLAVLRPLVPIAVLAAISGTTESAIRSFAFDLGRPLQVNGSSLHFLDEPSETWFRETFQPEEEKLVTFLSRLKPLAVTSSYVASTIPQLLLKAGRLDELVNLALTSEDLPTENPLERRDVEVQRLTFALNACLLERRYASAAKLALKLAGETAGVGRQNELIQSNTDLASALLSPDRIEELVSRRAFRGSWTGSHHAYEAGLLAWQSEFGPEARSRLRMAVDWVYSWARLSREERKQEHERVQSSDIAEITMAKLLAEGPSEAVDFLKGWRPRSLSMDVGTILARRMVDLGRFDLLDELAEYGARDIWLMLGLAAEAYEAGHTLPSKPLETLMRALGSRRIQLREPNGPLANWNVLNSVTCAVLQALRALPREDTAWAAIIRRYLPEFPPYELAARHSTDRPGLLRAYALEAALLDTPLVPMDLAPKNIREELEKKHSYSINSEATGFANAIGGLLSWFNLGAEIACGRVGKNFNEAAREALRATNAAKSNDYNNVFKLDQVAALEWLRSIRAATNFDPTMLEEFRKWFNERADGFGPAMMTAICRLAARNKDLQNFAMEVAVRAYGALENLREHAESRLESYVALARAIFPASTSEARTYFERAVEISSRVGRENPDRWGALLYLAEASGKDSAPRPHSAYRLARGAEIAYEYVDRDKHFDWRHTIDALLSLCPASTLAILSRWRDRNFGNADRLLENAIDGLVGRGLLPPIASIALCPIGDEWSRADELARALENEPDKAVRRRVLGVGYRYLRVSSPSQKELELVSQHARTCDFVAPDLDRLLAADKQSKSDGGDIDTTFVTEPLKTRNDPDWDVLFQGVDLTSSAALRSAYMLVRTFDPPYQIDEFYREALRRCGLAGAADFCLAIAQWPDVGNYELKHLLDIYGEQTTKPVSLRKAMAVVALSVCRRTPEWARRHRWGSVFPYRQLISEGIVTDKQIVDATLEGFLVKVTTLSAEELFQMLEPLASHLTNEEADEALHFGLSLHEHDLRPEDGDGPWDETMKPKGTCEDALAGYLWAALGSPSSAVRWEAAHAVRAIIELGWTSVLTALAKASVATEPGAFVDKRFVFYEWHSHLWLNMALARCAPEHPDMVYLFGEFLLSSVSEEHVLVRHFAAHALHELPKLSEEAAKFGAPTQINATALPLVEHTSKREPDDEAESSGAVTDEEVDKYYFGIDIGPYWLARLGAAFGISEGATTARARKAIVERIPGAITKSSHDARYAHGVLDHERTRHSHGSMPRVDDVRAYAAYHAMMIVAARLLKTHSIGKASYSNQNQFDEWIESRLLTRQDGKWAADRRDPRLTIAPPPPERYGDKEWRWQISSDYLDGRMRTDENLQVLAGDWTSGERESVETISITSALVPKPLSTAFLTAAQTSPDGRAYFFNLNEAGPAPTDAEDSGSSRGASGPSSHTDGTGQFMLRKWNSDQADSSGIDQYDPWGERVRVPGEAPTAETIVAMRLSSVDDGRIWATDSGAILRCETWTQVVGYGREADTISGTRLSANELFVKELLAANPGHCLVVGLSVQRRSSGSSGSSDNDEFIEYPPPYNRFYLIDHDGIPRTLKRSN